MQIRGPVQIRGPGRCRSGGRGARAGQSGPGRGPGVCRARSGGRGARAGQSGPGRGRGCAGPDPGAGADLARCAGPDLKAGAGLPVHKFGNGIGYFTGSKPVRKLVSQLAFFPPLFRGVNVSKHSLNMTAFKLGHPVNFFV